jgi:TPR repeat protein
MHFSRPLYSLAAILAALTLSPPHADARFVLPQDIATEAPVKETLSKLLAVKSSKDAEPFFAALKSAADAGSADALFAVAYLYQTGIGVEASAEKAKEAYQQAAAKGSAAAKNNLGLLRLGLGENPKDAVASIETAATAG